MMTWAARQDAELRRRLQELVKDARIVAADDDDSDEFDAGFNAGVETMVGMLNEILLDTTEWSGVD